MDVNLTSLTNLPQESYNFINNLGKNPIVLIVLAVIIVIYYIIFAVLGNRSGSFGSMETGVGESKGLVFVEALLWGLFIILILLNGLTYFFNIDIGASVKNLFSDEPEIEVKIDNIVTDLGEDLGIDSKTKPISETGVKQVFNIPGNTYTYTDAQSLRKAYGAELATYDQIAEAYKNGASWCNYGWSANQMAFFPTSKEVYDKLQKIKGHEHDCGRQGINGGYIANPNVRFGVNCYGDKPSITSAERKLMNQSNIFPKSNEDYLIDKKAQEYKKNLSSILVSPFNSSSWSKI